MKAKVLKPFIDMKEGITRSPGDTFSLSEERFAEINSTRFGCFVEAVEEPVKLGRMTKTELIEYAKTKGIPINESQTKKEILEAIGGRSHGTMACKGN